MNRLMLFAFSSFLFSPPSFAQAPFLDATATAGLVQTGKNYGTAIADFNNDGWDDIFAVRQEAPCRLYQNNGDGTFDEVSEAAGMDYVGEATCAVWADIDNDGWLDLLLGGRGENEDNLLYHNNGDGTFTDIAESAGVLLGGKIKSANFADVDMDGYVDIYLARFFKENILYKNNGDLTFTDISEWAGAGDNLLSMGAIFFDYDNDKDPDLYLIRDGTAPFILYQNLGNGKFVDVSFQSGTDIPDDGMGVDVGDINNDGWLDIYVTNLFPNNLLLNDGDDGFFGPSFTDIAIEAGVGDVGMTWGTAFLDFDNDGWTDIYMGNDSYYSMYPNRLFRHSGDPENITFESVGDDSPLANMEPTYGVACLDANDDGRVDLMVSNWLGDIGNQFFLNQVETDNNFIKLKCTGTESNRAAIGTKVTLEVGGMKMTDEIIAGASYSSSNSLTLHFGLGQNEIIDKLTLRWPNGLEEEYTDLPVNTTLSFTEGEGFLSALKSENASFVAFSASPNPFADRLEVQLELEEGQEVSLEIIGADGQLLDSRHLGYLSAGPHGFVFDGKDFPAGILLCRLVGENGGRTQRVMKR